MNRRFFLKNTGLGTLGTLLGINVPFEKFFPKGLIPAAFAASQDSFILEGKDGLRILNDLPVNAETPPHLLDDEVTPTSRLFIRNNGIVPHIATTQDTRDWKLMIDGEVGQPMEFTLSDLKKNFRVVTKQIVLECGGNGRAGFDPPARGNQWTYGAVGCPQWTGVRLGEVLRKTGVKKTAIYMAYYGLDTHLSGDTRKVVISRGTPIQNALDPHTLLVFEMNGTPLPAAHGFPLRLICPGFPGSASGKWLRRITLRDRVHDGPKMNGYSYRVPKYAVSPGQHVPEEDMKIIESMPVKSLITFPRSGVEVSESQAKSFHCRGFAWTSEKKITNVDVSYDFGQTWHSASLNAPVNRYAWQRWTTTLSLPQKGYFEIWARAKDTSGRMQPMIVPGWNPKGYLNNAMPRIAVHVV